MSIVAKICSTLLQNSLRTTIGNAIINPTARNFHTLLKPLPRLANEASCLPKTPAVNDVVAPTSSLLPGFQRLLTPVSSLLNQVAGFKVKGRLKRRCKDCYFVIRQQRHYVICPTHPRHKQMSMKKRDYKSWILTHATQSKVRPY